MPKADRCLLTTSESCRTAWIYHELWGSVKAGKVSMLQDLELGIKSEIEYINGILSKTGRKFGITTPVNDRLWKSSKALRKVC